ELAQALRGIEAEHPLHGSRADVEGAEGAQGDGLAAFERDIDLLERGLQDFFDQGGLLTGAVCDATHELRLFDALPHLAPPRFARSFTRSCAPSELCALERLPRSGMQPILRHMPTAVRSMDDREQTRRDG